MARGRKKATVPQNSATPEMIQLFTSDIERLEGEMESKKGEYMAWCKGHRELINRQYDAANNAGVSRKALKAKIKVRKLEAKKEKIEAELDDNEVVAEAYKTISEALGDFLDSPLGQAAQGREGSDEDWDKTGQENAAKIAAGIKGMPGADAQHA